VQVGPLAVKDVMTSDDRHFAPFRDEDHVVRGGAARDAPSWQRWVENGRQALLWHRRCVQLRKGVKDVMTSDDRHFAPFRDEDHVVRRREAHKAWLDVRIRTVRRRSCSRRSELATLG
jgi:hypothetical protein